MLSNGLYVNQIEDFTVVGINYRKSAADVRGHYTINEEQYKIILDIAPALGLNDFFVLSTCNRTEIYGCVHHIELFDTTQEKKRQSVYQKQLQLPDGFCP